MCALCLQFVHFLPYLLQKYIIVLCYESYLPIYNLDEIQMRPGCCSSWYQRLKIRDDAAVKSVTKTKRVYECGVQHCFTSSLPLLVALQCILVSYRHPLISGTVWNHGWIMSTACECVHGCPLVLLRGPKPSCTQQWTTAPFGSNTPINANELCISLILIKRGWHLFKCSEFIFFCIPAVCRCVGVISTSMCCLCALI